MILDFNEFGDNHISEKCYHETQFSPGELEAVRLYIQQRFAKTYPVRPPCKKFHVRKDIKCLTKKESYELISVFKALYANGVFDLFSLVHGSYWPAIHKFAEAVPWHRLHINRFEKEMRKINPNITLPYWVRLIIFFQSKDKLHDH